MASNYIASNYMASNYSHLLLHISLSAQSSCVFHEVFLIVCMLCGIRLSLGRVMYCILPAIVGILLKPTDTFWCFLRILHIFYGSLNQMVVLH
jgi:hypothetical protein